MRKASHFIHWAMTIAAVMLLSITSVFAGGMEHWENEMVTASGSGVAPPDAINPTHARLLAREAAIVVAQRQLAATVQGLQIDSETTVEKMMTKSDTISRKISAFIKGARVIDERDIPGGYTVTMAVPMYGVSNSIASAVFPPTSQPESFPAPDASVESNRTVVSVDIDVRQGNTSSMPTPEFSPHPLAAEAPAGGRAMGGFTGLIVDCRGLDIRPVMSPVIKNANGQPIYGYKNLESSKVIAHGMAGYAFDLSKAGRAGSHPLIVKAIGVDNHSSNPILSVEDANRVLIENGASGFLDRMNVVLLR